MPATSRSGHEPHGVWAVMPQIEIFRTLLRILLRDAAGIGVYWVLACALSRLAAIAPAWVAMALSLLLWLLLFSVLFFSHGELFRWVKNNRTWVLSSGVLTLAVMLPVVMISLDNPCPWATIEYAAVDTRH